MHEPSLPRTSSRRCFLAVAGSSLLVHSFPRSASARSSDPAAAIEVCHKQLLGRFRTKQNVMLDFTDLDGSVTLPTAEDCKLRRPNALGWWTPIENGPMFNGMFMDALCLRAESTGQSIDRENARRCAEGLLFLANVGSTPGFICRGVAEDGHAHYPMGSNDQTSPWIYGLWRYLQTDLPTDSERQTITQKLTEVVRVLESTKWRMPCDGPPAPFRGSFAGFHWEAAPRLLFVLKMMHQLTGESHWDELYQTSLHQMPTNANQHDRQHDRLTVCSEGMRYHGNRRETWTAAPGVAALRCLWEMEKDPRIRSEYEKGLIASAQLAAEGLPLARQFDNSDNQVFLHDWRKLNEWWQPQSNEKEAVDVALAEARHFGKLSPRRNVENRFVREPLFSAWVLTLCPKPEVVAEHRAALLETLAHYQYDRLYYSQFFPAESAWWRLQSAKS